MSLTRKLRNNQLLRRIRFLRTPIKHIFRFFLRLITLNRGVKIDLGGQMPVRLDYRFYFNRYETWGNAHNDGFLKLLETCQGKDVVLDVGAHIGLCALPISKVISPNGKVYAFEPSMGNLTYLQKHIAYNKTQNISVLPFLVGEHSKDDVSFYESPEPTGMNALIQYKDLPNANWVTRRQISLDDFCQEHNIIPNVIKIDVEGAEVGVLRGARKTIYEHQPTVILSIHPRHLQLMGESIDTLTKIIADMQYNITDMVGQDVHVFELKEYLLHPQKASCVPNKT